MARSAAVSRALEITATADSTAEELYNYLTRGSLLSRWLCEKAEADPTEGGKFSLWIDSTEGDQPDIYGQFVKLIENQTIQYFWIDERREVRSLVTAVITQKIDCVRVDLYHTSLPIDKEFDQTFHDYARFWKHSLEKLVAHLAT